MRLLATLSMAMAALATTSAGATAHRAGAKESPAHQARSCQPYTVTAKRVFGGEHWTYTLRIQQITADHVSCSASRALIRRADKVFASGQHDVGVYYDVQAWRCEELRPFDGPQFLQNEDCKRTTGARLSWQEKQLRARRTR